MKNILNILSLILISFSAFCLESPPWTYTTDTTQGVPISQSHPLYINVKHKIDSIINGSDKNFIGCLRIKFTIDSTQKMDSIAQIKFVHPILDTPFINLVYYADSSLLYNLQFSKLYSLTIPIEHENSKYLGARVLMADCNYQKAVKILKKLYIEYPESSEILFYLAKSLICSKKQEEGLELMRKASEIGDCDAIDYLQNRKGCC